MCISPLCVSFPCRVLSSDTSCLGARKRLYSTCSSSDSPSRKRRRHFFTQPRDISTASASSPVGREYRVTTMVQYPYGSFEREGSVNLEALLVSLSRKSTVVTIKSVRSRNACQNTKRKTLVRREWLIKLRAKQASWLEKLRKNWEK